MDGPGEKPRDTRAKAVSLRIAQVASMWLAQAIVLLGLSGDPRWSGAIAYLALYLLLLAVNAVLLLPRHADLVAERGRFPKEAKAWDRRIAFALMVAVIGFFLAAAIGHRFGPTPPTPILVPLLGAVLFVSGFALFTWAMASNPYFSSLVRIQYERGHRVVTGGPYRRLRHPGYLGQILSLFGTLLLLGSWWAIVPGIAEVVLIVVRTGLEDRTLIAELTGYREYAGRVRTRLVPGVW